MFSDACPPCGIKRKPKGDMRRPGLKPIATRWQSDRLRRYLCPGMAISEWQNTHQRDCRGEIPICTGRGLPPTPPGIQSPCPGERATGEALLTAARGRGNEATFVEKVGLLPRADVSKNCKCKKPGVPACRLELGGAEGERACPTAILPWEQTVVSPQGYCSINGKTAEFA